MFEIVTSERGCLGIKVISWRPELRSLLLFSLPPFAPQPHPSKYQPQNGVAELSPDLISRMVGEDLDLFH
jgi:hypothetical protein